MCVEGGSGWQRTLLTQPCTSWVPWRLAALKALKTAFLARLPSLTENSAAAAVIRQHTGVAWRGRNSQGGYRKIFISVPEYMLHPTQGLPEILKGTLKRAGGLCEEEGTKKYTPSLDRWWSLETSMLQKHKSTVLCREVKEQKTILCQDSQKERIIGF